MKTLIFICILAVVAADLNAQIEKISKVLEYQSVLCLFYLLSGLSCM